MASMDGIFYSGAAGVAISDPLEDPNRVTLAKPKSTLKIVFVDSCPNRRSTRLRRSQAQTVRQSHEVSRGMEDGSTGSDADTCPQSMWCKASGDESDQEYDDQEARWSTRTRPGRNKQPSRRQKRHGKLAAADRDLLREAGQPGLPRKPPKKKAITIAITDAIDLVANMAEKIDWRQAVAAQFDLQLVTQESLIKLEELKCGMDSGSSSMGQKTALADLQLKQYWSEVLVDSMLGMKTK